MSQLRALLAERPPSRAPALPELKTLIARKSCEGDLAVTSKDLSGLRAQAELHARSVGPGGRGVFSPGLRVRGSVQLLASYEWFGLGCSRPGFRAWEGVFMALLFGVSL